MKIKNTKKVSYRYTNNRGRKTPAIIIEGLFLDKLGFKIGDTANIDYQRNKIIIYK